MSLSTIALAVFMKAIIPEGFGPSVRLTLGERKRPVPGKNDVLVKVHAASVNPKDWKLNLTLARAAPPLGRRLIPPLFGDDLAGEIVQLGAGVEGFEVGDRVYGMDMRLRTATLAEYAVIDTRRIALMPANTGFIEAAAVPLAGQTALQGLRKGQAGPGRSVLIIGASGGVGSYAVQIARQLGCHVTGVCSTRNIELVQSLGADAVIDYTAGDYRQPAPGQRRAFDLVFDVTAYETPASCGALLAPAGYFISTMGHARPALRTLLSRRRNASLLRVESWTADLQTIGEWMTAGAVRSVIDSRFTLAEAQQAYERSRSGRARGKIVIAVTPG
ncbi:NAD(P)-dependent alcohol dehydrogenase [Salinisphaera sp. S4-8]|uniref:NAD(P)-dependent alcohol dehydrogenase n=1 Tax=Salinisphaera sp. S4-8 TaxID=633357 RepID=UPI00333F71B9